MNELKLTIGTKTLQEAMAEKEAELKPQRDIIAETNREMVSFFNANRNKSKTELITLMCDEFNINENEIRDKLGMNQ